MSEENPEIEEIIPEKVRKYVRTSYENILKNASVNNFKDISKQLELGTYDYALVKGDDRNKHIISYYKQIYIKMLGNLSLNENSEYVLDKIKKGKWDLNTLPSYPREALFPKKWETIHKETEEENKDIVIKKKGAYRCPRCKSWYTNHVEVQTRSADEPMGCRCSCLDCGHKWKFG